jgi:hypothetical protein
LDTARAGRESDGLYEKPVLRGLMSFVSEMWSFLRIRKKYWLVPAILILAIFGALIVLSSGTAVAPFIYTLF